MSQTSYEDVFTRIGRLLDTQTRRSEDNLLKATQRSEDMLLKATQRSEDNILKIIKSLTNGTVNIAIPPTTKRKVVAAAPLPTKARKIAGRPAAAKPVPAKPAAKAAKRVVSERSADRLVDRLVSVMRDKVMDAAEVVEALQKAGKAPNSANLQNYISFTLSQNDDTFERVARGKYKVISGKADRVTSETTSEPIVAESGGPGYSTTDEELGELGINPKGSASNPFPEP